MHQFNVLVWNNSSNNQMVQTRSEEGQYIPLVIRAHIVNRQNQAPPPPPLNQMDPALQQFFATQTQLLQNLTATVRTYKLNRTNQHPLLHLRHNRGTSIRNLWATTLLPIPILPICWMPMTGRRQLPRNLRSFSAPTERWSFMLQADWQGKLLIGGMHIWVYILI
jgi:hypothetical protein